MEPPGIHHWEISDARHKTVGFILKVSPFPSNAFRAGGKAIREDKFRSIFARAR